MQKLKLKSSGNCIEEKRIKEIKYSFDRQTEIKRCYCITRMILHMHMKNLTNVVPELSVQLIHCLRNREGGNFCYLIYLSECMLRLQIDKYFHWPAI